MNLVPTFCSYTLRFLFLFDIYSGFMEFILRLPSLWLALNKARKDSLLRQGIFIFSVSAKGIMSALKINFATINSNISQKEKLDVLHIYEFILQNQK